MKQQKQNEKAIVIDVPDHFAFNQDDNECIIKIKAELLN